MIDIEKFPTIVDVAKDFAKMAIKGCPAYKESEEQIMMAVDYGHERAWTQLETMGFGDAIRALKAGKKVRRKNWDCVGAFLWLKPATNVKAEWCKDPMLKDLAEKAGGEIPASDTICMFTAQHTILTGWIPQQSDMFADDWEVID